MLHNTSHEDGAMSGQVECAGSPQGSEMCPPIHKDGDMSGQVQRADNPRDSEMSPFNSVTETLHGVVEAFSGLEKCAARSQRKDISNASTAPRSMDLLTPLSRHAARGHARDMYRSRSSSGSTIRSWNSDYLSHTFRSRHDGSQHSNNRSRSHALSPPARSRHEQRAQRCDDRSRSDAPSSPARSRHDQRAQRSDLCSPPYDRHVTNSGRWDFPLPWGVFQKKVLSLLIDIHHRLKETQPASSAVHIERIDTMEDFEIQEQRLCDAKAFDILVLQISRIGGRNTKDCVHKV
ncbi:uncharacterized protein [Misgurnus anguillicaudatus]|uniref:uncharacterized protein n=1 Tax=Misgurnus anguillicaudatus TaxID=75329 RepID=UPI003CCF4BB4